MLKKMKEKQTSASVANTTTRIIKYSNLNITREKNR